MKASEVRIGNIVQHKIVDETIGQQCIIDALDIVAISQFESASKKHPYHAIELTKEWLLNFGFEKDGEYNNCYHNNIAIYEGDTFTYNVSFFEHDNLIEIEYVHELQNLFFALTKEELVLAANPL